MAILSDDIRLQLRDRFAERLVGPVQLKLYVKPGSGRLILPSGLGCATCEDARSLSEDLQEAAPDQISLEVVDVGSEPEPEVPDVPLLTVGVPDEKPRIRFMGLPAGYEFATVVDALERVSRQEPGLSPASLERLERLQEPAEIMVFATPTWRYCPQAVSLANRMALASPKVTALAVEANEFPRLSQSFSVQGVPRTVVNRMGAFVGALPEEQFVASALRLAGVQDPPEAESEAEPET